MPADVCIVKCNHSFLLLEQLNDVVMASLFPKLCEATVKILDLLTAITFTKTYHKKEKKNPTYPASNVTLRLILHIFVQTSVYDEDNCGILSDIIGGKNVARCGLKSSSKHKFNLFK